MYACVRDNDACEERERNETVSCNVGENGVRVE